ALPCRKRPRPPIRTRRHGRGRHRSVATDPHQRSRRFLVRVARHVDEGAGLRDTELRRAGLEDTEEASAYGLNDAFNDGCWRPCHPQCLQIEWHCHQCAVTHVYEVTTWNISG